MINNYLTYGSVISISNVIDDDSFVTSNGFIKSNVLLRNYVIKILYSIFNRNVLMKKILSLQSQRRIDPIIIVFTRFFPKLPTLSN